LSETYFILRGIERDMIKMFIGLPVKYTSFLLHFKEILIFLTIFRKKKHTNNKFYENPSSGRRGVQCGQTDRHDEAQ